MTGFVNGEKVRLRPYDKGDVDWLLANLNREEQRRIAFDATPVTRAAVEADVAAGPGVHHRFIVEEEATGRPVGAAGLAGVDLVNRRADLWIGLFEASDRGRGLGSDAIACILRYGFAHLGLNRVGLGVFASNPDARRLYERLGFVHEGTRREGVFKDGRFVDEHVYGMLAREWHAQNPRDA